VRAGGAPRFATTHGLFAESHLGMVLGAEGTRTLELGAGENEKTSQIVLIHFLDRVQEVTVERHHATDSGANSLVTVRRSVSVHPCGGIIRSAWSAHREYPKGSASATRSSSQTAAAP